MEAISDPLRNVLDRLDGVKKNGRGFIARCPAHDDHNPSLSVREGDDRRVLVHCFAGCDVQAITGAIGLTMGDLFLDPISPVPSNRQRSSPPPRPKPIPPKERIHSTTMNHPSLGAAPIKTYAYRTTGGDLVRVKARYRKPDGAKDFRWFSPAAGGGWYIDKDEAAPPTLYGAEKLPAEMDAVVHLSESEKDRDALEALDLLAVAAGGATAWNEALAGQLAGREVAILTHNDEGGRAFTRQAVADLLHAGAVVRDVQLPGLPEKGDVVDWLDNGGTVERLLAFVAATEPEVPPTDADTDTAPIRLATMRVLLGARMIDGVAPPDHLQAGVLLRGGVHILMGEPESGKTIIALWMALKTMEKGLPVLYFDEESGPDMLTERLEAMGADPTLLDEYFHYIPFAGFGVGAEDIAEILDYIGVVRPRLIVVDSLADSLQAANLDENDALDITAFMKAWPVPAARQDNCTVVLLDHVTKAQEHTGYSRGSGAKKSKADAMWLVVKSAEFSRDKLGTVEMKRKKDRSGTLPALIRLTVGGRQGELICTQQAEAWEEPKTLSEGAVTVLRALAEFPKEGARFAEWMRKTDVSETSFRRHIGELKNAECLRHVEKRYSLTDSGRATLSGSFYSTATTANGGTLAVNSGTATTATPLKGGGGGGIHGSTTDEEEIEI